MARRLTLAVLSVLALLSAAQAQPTPPALQVVLGTATPGGGFPAYGEALAKAVHEVDPALTVELRTTKGSTENLILLREGKLDLALVQGEYAFDALAAQGDTPGLTVVAPVDTTPGMFVVPAASSIHAVSDLRGKAIALGTRSSGLTVMGRTVLKGSGIDPEHDITPILLDRAGDGPTLVIDGKAAALWGGSVGWPGFKTMAEAPGGARFFGPAPEAVEAILALRPSLRRLTIPAKSFKGQDAAIDTVGSWSFTMGKPGLDPAVVSRLVRAIDQGKARLAQLYAQGGESDPRNLPGATKAKWLHPATIDYLKEIGALPR
ncbi:TAXI family TRAP transporter solute-binding subunit [Methylobacterium sp. C25]|uniref:TAXI family TRAP transporter solute-binding subunit n=1 Tax=Methylobacterium sp. C25 TaxID=2721622 RepID=UPI001F17D78C|nr:TAXI family TRAP transporter solute-binding subunit [Methylobacterium sp. C25]MCE4223643.1 TAXI family TRAP transporter solute-binding subunit [Methylobacterium sp. C25]